MYTSLFMMMASSVRKKRKKNKVAAAKRQATREAEKRGSGVGVGILTYFSIYIAIE
jgi:hypothetical protein